MIRNLRLSPQISTDEIQVLRLSLDSRKNETLKEVTGKFNNYLLFKSMNLGEVTG